MENFILLPNGTAKYVDLSSSKSLSVNLNWLEDYYRFANNDRGQMQAYAASVLMHRCITVKANTFSTLPKRFVDDDDNELDKTHIIRRALGKRRTKLWRLISQDWDIFGRVFLEPVRHPTTGAVYFNRLNPYTMTVIKDEHGISEFRQEINGSVVARWQPSQLVYIWDYNPQDDLEGLSPTNYILKNVITELSIADFVKSYFENGGTPAGILTTDQLLRPAQASQYAREWHDNYGGSNNSNKVAVVGGGLKYQQLTPTIKDMVVDTIGVSNAKRICQVYGVPLSLALESQEETHATAQSSRESFYKETIIPTFQFIADELSEQAIPFVTSESIYVEADLFQIDVLQNDRKIITERSTTGFKSGVRTLNEARRLEQLPTIAGGDVLFLGGRLIPTSKLTDDPDTLNMILEGTPLNGSFTPNNTEPVNPDPDKQSFRLREEISKSFLAVSKVAIVSELRTWKKKAQNRGADTEFVSNVIPASYQDFIRIDLKYMPINDVFDKYINMFENLVNTNDDLSYVIDFDNYWKGQLNRFNKTEVVLRELFFSQLRDEAVSYVISSGNLGLNLALEAKRQKLNKVLPTLGVELAMEAINSASNGDGNAIMKAFPKVEKIVLSFTRQFIDNVIKTTIDIVVDKLAVWLSLGGTRESFAKYLSDGVNTLENFLPEKLNWLFSSERIYRLTEDFTNSVYNTGMIETFETLSKGAIWLTELDDRVCSVCRPLHGVIGSATEGFINPIDNQVYFAPAHTKCRCFYTATSPDTIGYRF